jgi:hypothetical protein
MRKKNETGKYFVMRRFTNFVPLPTATESLNQVAIEGWGMGCIGWEDLH